MAEAERSLRDVDLSSLNLNVNMAGITFAIFTFLLFFLFPTSSAGGQPLLLQLTLGLNVAAIFSFSLAALYSYVLVYSRPARHAKLATHLHRSSLFFEIGLFALLLEPFLILVIINYYVVAVVSLALYIIYALTYFNESNTVQRIRRGSRVSSS